LAEVVQQIERQTREKVRLDPKLDAKVTLDVKNMPLTNVLDSLAEQANARWGKTYAVYQSDMALRRLESALTGGSSMEEAGWTNLAPQLGKMDLPMPDFAGGPGPGKIVVNSREGASLGATPVFRDEDIQKFVQDKIKEGTNVIHNSDGTVRTITATANGPGGTRVIKMSPGGTIVEKGGPDDGSRPQMKNIIVRRTAGPGGMTTTVTDGDGKVRTTRTSADGSIVKEDQWSAECLVMETPLSSRLGDAIPTKASVEAATQAAVKVQGRYATYYALEKPPIAGDPSMRKLVRQSFQIGGTNSPLVNGDIRSRVEAEAKQRRLEELSLSPEQQVQRARQKQEAESPK